MAALHAQYIHEELQDLGLDDYLSDGEEDSEDQVLYENDQRRTLLAFLQQDQPSVPTWKKPASQPPPDSGKGCAARLSSQNKNVSPGWRSSSQILSSRHEDSCQDAGSSFALDNFAASFDNPAEWEDGPPLVAAPPHSETAALDAFFHFSASLTADEVSDQPAAASQQPTQQTDETKQTQSAEQKHLQPPADSHLPSLPSPPSPSLSTHHTSADGRSQSEDEHLFSHKIMTPISDRPSVLHQMLSLSQKLPPSSEPIQTDTTVGSPGSSYHPHSHSHYTSQTPASLEEEEDIAAKTDTRPEEEGEEEGEGEGEGSDLRFTDANTTDSPKHTPMDSQPTVHPPAKKQRRPQVWKESHSKQAERTTSTSLKPADKDTSEAMTPTWAGVPSSSFLRFPSVQVSQPGLKPGRGGRSKARPPKPKLTFSVKRAAVQRNEFDTPEEDPSQAVRGGAGFRMAQMLQKLTGGPPRLNARQSQLLQTRSTSSIVSDHCYLHLPLSQQQQQQPSMSQRAKEVGKKKKEGGRHREWSESKRDGEQIADGEDGGWEEEEEEEEQKEREGGEDAILPSPTQPGKGSQRMMEQFRNGLPAATFGLPFRLPLSQRGSVNLTTALQRVVDQEKHSRTQFLRAYNSGRPVAGATDTLDVMIQASSLEGHITKCACRVVQQPKSWLTDRGGSFATAESRGNTTRPGAVQVWFAARLYSDVDFETGAMVRVCAPWHEIHTDKQSLIILCNSFAMQLENG